MKRGRYPSKLRVSSEVAVPLTSANQKFMYAAIVKNHNCVTYTSRSLRLSLTRRL